DVELLRAELAQAPLQLRTLGRARRVRLDRLVVRLGDAGDAVGAHGCDSRGVEVIRYAVDGWGVGEVRIADGRVVWHDLPRAGLPLSDEPRTGNGRVPFLSPHPGGADNPPP